MTDSQLATDATTGAVVLGGVTIAGKGGVYVQQVFPSTGTKVVLPLPVGLNDWNASLSDRPGAAGVYVAYADGKAVHLYRYGGGSKTLARGAFTSAAVCPGPDGRLWVAWGGPSGGLVRHALEQGGGRLRTDAEARAAARRRRLDLHAVRGLGWTARPVR